MIRHVGAAVLATIGVVAWLGGHPCFASEEEKPKPPIKIEYANGFRFTSADRAFSLRLYSGIQMRFTVTDFDRRVAGNEEDTANFFIRRARLWWDGYAFSRRFTYSFHLQLEPTSAVNLHDAWVQYEFSDAFRLGVGRNKINYGAEFLASAFFLNFVERSILYGETDISQGTAATWPGGGTAPLLLSSEHPHTGFPTGGLCLFRSQGLMISGRKPLRKDAIGTWEVGVWNGRNSRGLANPDGRLLTSTRVSLYPFGQFDPTVQGDLERSVKPKAALLLSWYQDGGQRLRDAAGRPVAAYDVRDEGKNAAFLVRWQGFSADMEVGRESYWMQRQEPGKGQFERQGWRTSVGYFVVPRRLEVVARTARLERLRHPTREAALHSGLGLARVKVGGDEVETVERVLEEQTVGVNLYFGHGHQHKLFLDGTVLRRRFADAGEGVPPPQRDRRLRSMFQFRF